jgi:ElaB/YqjD/DUF883 family membrane-anchored ribosome-binding protein
LAAKQRGHRGVDMKKNLDLESKIESLEETLEEKLEAMAKKLERIKKKFKKKLKKLKPNSGATGDNHD